MGRPMVSCVSAAGLTVRAFDVDARQLEGLGLVAVPTAQEAVREADVVVLMVATAAQCEEALFGELGMKTALRKGSVVMVMATVGPQAVERWSERLSEHGIDLVDAPVSGGVSKAATGELLTMVAGSRSAVSKVQPVLDAVSRSTAVISNHAGDGQRMKLVNQLLCGVHIAAAAEALAFAEALGIDAQSAWEVVRLGAAASFMLEDRGPRMLAGTFDDVRSAVEIFVKDMRLVTGAAQSSTYPAPLASAAEQVYLAANRAGLGRLDDSSIISVARRRASLQPTAQAQVSVRNGRAAVEFYKAAFGAVEAYRFGGTDDHEDVVAQLAVGGSFFWVEDESPAHGNFSPETVGGATTRMLLVVDDPTTVQRQAVAAGAAEVSAVGEEHGWLLGRIDDPFGHRWEIGKPLGLWPPAS